MNESKTAYPLCWPERRARSPRPGPVAVFKTSFARSRDECTLEIRRLNGTDVVISTNMSLKTNGEPYAVELGKHIPDPGVAVYFKRKGKELCFACDKWAHVQDNMHAITLTIAALRGVARWGTGDMMEAAFTGFAQLPERTGGESWWTVLGVPVNAGARQVKEAFRVKARETHPDHGGTAEAFHRAQEAYRQAMQVVAPGE